MKRCALLLCLLAAIMLSSCASPTPAEARPPEALPEEEAAPETPDEGENVHSLADEPQTVENPVSGYCGNTVTEVALDGETYSFWGSDSVALTDIVINLDYSEEICRCPVEFAVDTEVTKGYGINLEQGFVRCSEGQAPLTADQVETIQGVLDRNCK